MASDVKFGSAFASFEELQPQLQKYQEEEQVLYHYFCSVPVNTYNAKHGTFLPGKLKYESFTYACKHYGTPRSNSTGQRVNQRYASEI